MLIQRAAVREVILAPRVVENRVSIQHPPGVSIQQFQNLNVPQTQFDGPLSTNRSQFGREDFEVVHYERLRGIDTSGNMATACHGSNPGNDFPHSERLDDEIVCSQLKADDFVDLLRFRADKNNRNIRMRGSDG